MWNPFASRCWFQISRPFSFSLSLSLIHGLDHGGLCTGLAVGFACFSCIAASSDNGRFVIFIQLLVFCLKYVLHLLSLQCLFFFDSFSFIMALVIVLGKTRILHIDGFNPLSYCLLFSFFEWLYFSLVSFEKKYSLAHGIPWPVHISWFWFIWNCVNGNVGLMVLKLALSPNPFNFVCNFSVWFSGTTGVKS